MTDTFRPIVQNFQYATPLHVHGGVIRVRDFLSTGYTLALSAVGEDGRTNFYLTDQDVDDLITILQYMKTPIIPKERWR